MLLLDTCVLLWLAADQGLLSPRARTLLATNRGLIHVSAISAFEIGIKCRKKALALPLPPDEWYSTALEFHGLKELSVTGIIACRSTLLPTFHADPCDRIIIATAQVESLTILSPDPLFREYPGTRVEW